MVRHVDVASLPAIASAAVSPDAELIALGREIEAFLPRHAIVTLESCVRSWRAHRLAVERSGFDNSNATQPKTPEEIAAFQASVVRLQAASREAEAEFDCAAWEADYELVLAEENRLMEMVCALTATTAEGIRVKALAMAMVNVILIAHDPETLDYYEDLNRGFAMAVLASLNVKMPDHLIGAASVPGNALN